jgi:hypothetical protein
MHRPAGGLAQASTASAPEPERGKPSLLVSASANSQEQGLGRAIPANRLATPGIRKLAAVMYKEAA